MKLGKPTNLDPDALYETIEEMRNYISELHEKQATLEGDNVALKNQIRKLMDERYDYMQKFSVYY